MERREAAANGEKETTKVWKFLKLLSIPDNPFWIQPNAILYFGCQMCSVFVVFVSGFAIHLLLLCTGTGKDVVAICNNFMRIVSILLQLYTLFENLFCFPFLSIFLSHFSFDFLSIIVKYFYYSHYVVLFTLLLLQLMRCT